MKKDFLEIKKSLSITLYMLSHAERKMQKNLFIVNDTFELTFHSNASFSMQRRRRRRLPTKNLLAKKFPPTEMKNRQKFSHDKSFI